MGHTFVNGSRNNQSTLSLDGGNATDNGNNVDQIVTVSLDSVQEFKALTAAFQAQYGWCPATDQSASLRTPGIRFSKASGLRPFTSIFCNCSPTIESDRSPPSVLNSTPWACTSTV